VHIEGVSESYSRGPSLRLIEQEAKVLYVGKGAGKWSFQCCCFVIVVANIRVYRTVVLPVVLYGCETWSRTLREKQRLRVFENRVLRRIFGPKGDEATGEWRRLHNEELNDLYSSPNIIRVIKPRRMRWVGHVARMGKREVHTGFW
jgi:hypothetical protein